VVTEKLLYKYIVFAVVYGNHPENVNGKNSSVVFAIIAHTFITPPPHLFLGAVVYHSGNCAPLSVRKSAAVSLNAKIACARKSKYL